MVVTRWWRVNQIVNAIAVLALAAALVYLAVRWLGWTADANADPHGYGLIFGVLIAPLLVLPLFVLALAARDLRAKRPSGFVRQLVASPLLAVLGLLAFGVPGGVVVGYAVLLAVVALAGRRAHHRVRTRTR